MGLRPSERGRDHGADVVSAEDVYTPFETEDDLRAHVAELRHALEHVVDCQLNDGGCSDCTRMSTFALEYGGHGDFLELVRWQDNQE